jgi:hypothetical protein
MPESNVYDLPTARLMVVSTADARELARRFLALGMSAASTTEKLEKSDLKIAGQLLLLLLEDYRDQTQLAVDAE